ncbi:MAG TPA: glycoside hydrolase [Sphaerochaeta sp.]|nr:glycoside hydrolase [Sphaerochaeta sp.]
MVKRVHVVFKTHLDIGFTDLAEHTVSRYMHQFIPHAIETARLLRERGGKERLVWTTGSWLIDMYLKRAKGEALSQFVTALQEGDIVWHSLPFTTHTELMDKNLCSYGLSLSKRLDQRFSRQSIAAKMTDVPGHSLALVPYLAANGVAFLHIGVNGGSPVPAVPPLFRWRCPSGEEVLVQYDGTYGSSTAFEGLEDVLVIENSADNSGPPSMEEVLAVYRRLEREYPGSEILASDLSSYARNIISKKDLFPLVQEEIGDTWIHGVGTDPKKVSHLRMLLSLSETWEMEGSLKKGTEAYDGFMASLLLVVEHTWGMDFKKYLADYKNWSVDDFAQAREKDVISPDAITEEYRYIEEFAKKEYEHIFPGKAEKRKTRTYSFFESAHTEQRAYLEQAVAFLNPSLAQQYRTMVGAEEPSKVRQKGYQEKGVALACDDVHTIGKSHVTFASDGSIASLVDGTFGELVGKEGLGVYRYQSFSAETYQRWHHTYNREYEENKEWLLADFGKPGMEHAIPQATDALFAAVLTSLIEYRSEGKIEVVSTLEATEDTPRGAPRNVIITYGFSLEGRLETIALDWFDKEATRLPEALWLSVGFSMQDKGGWKMVKIGQSLPLGPTVSKGARSIHAVEALEYGTTLVVQNLDSPLVSLGKRKLLDFDDAPALENGCFHFNLCNNIWGTNFPLWYEEDGRSRIHLAWKP